MKTWITALVLVVLTGCSAEVKIDDTPDAKDIVLGLYDAFGRGDVPAVIGAMADDIVWNEADNFPYAGGNPYVGPDAIVQGVFGPIMNDWSSWHPRKDRVTAAGNTVVVEGYYEGTLKATGNSHEIQYVHIWTVEGGKIVRFQQYADTLKASKAMAGGE